MKKIIEAIKSKLNIASYDVSDCPFTPTAIGDKKVLCLIGDTAICG